MWGPGNAESNGAARDGAGSGVGRRGLLAAALALAAALVPERLAGARPHRRPRRPRPGDPPTGCVVQIKDVQVVFRAGSQAARELSAWDVDNDGEGLPIRWPNVVVRPRQELRLKGWYPHLGLRLFGRPDLWIDAYNPCLGWPTVEVWAQSATERRRLLLKGFDVGETATIPGFEVARLEDDEYYKVFLVRALD
jgi:hypothetical protein